MLSNHCSFKLCYSGGYWMERNCLSHTELWNLYTCWSWLSVSSVRTISNTLYCMFAADVQYSGEMARKITSSLRALYHVILITSILTKIQAIMWWHTTVVRRYHQTQRVQGVAMRIFIKRLMWKTNLKKSASSFNLFEVSCTELEWTAIVYICVFITVFIGIVCWILFATSSW